jgi:uncharacterized protein
VIRAIIDTNVLVSALISPNGNEALILLAIQQGLVRPCYSEEILREYAAVPARPKFAFPADEIEAELAMCEVRGELFRPEASSVASPDPGDQKFLACAEAAGADFIVTGNKRDFPQAQYGPTRIANASELLDRITLELEAANTMSGAPQQIGQSHRLGLPHPMAARRRSRLAAGQTLRES